MLESKKKFPGGLTLLMSVYAKDSPSLFKQALSSVYANNILPDDFILIIDGPVSLAMETVICDLQLKHELKVFRLDVNVGLRNALNFALPFINTTWVARADADDINLTNRFARQLAVIEEKNSRLDLVGGSIQEVDLDGSLIAFRRMPENQNDIYKFARRRNPFNHMTVIFRLSLVLECGGYPDVYLKEDYGLWALMLSKGARVVNIPEVIVKATTGNDFYARRGGIRLAMAEYKLQRLLWKLGIKPLWLAFFDFIFRGSVFISPAILRKLVYSKFLRQLY